MVCENCLKEKHDSFFEGTCVFVSRRNLDTFLLNVLLNIKKDWKQFCRCSDALAERSCLVCQFRDVFENDEYDIYENCFDLHFFALFHMNIYTNLKKLVSLQNHVVCHLDNVLFRYYFKNWYSGKDEYFDVCFVLYLHEEKETSKIVKK